MRGSAKQVAADWLDKLTGPNPPRWSAKRMANFYWITDSKARSVISWAKDLSIKQGLYFGYDPWPSGTEGSFRVCPAGALNVQARMLGFAAGLAMAEIRALDKAVLMNQAAGFVNVETANECQFKVRDGEAIIREIARALGVDVARVESAY